MATIAGERNLITSARPQAAADNPAEVKSAALAAGEFVERETLDLSLEQAVIVQLGAKMQEDARRGRSRRGP